MRAILQAIMPYELHGTRYYQVIYQPEPEGQLQQARLSHDMVDEGLQPGDPIEVNAILGVVDSVRRATEGEAR